MRSSNTARTATIHRAAFHERANVGRRLRLPSATARGWPRPASRRVLHVINGEHYAGAERVQDLLALSLPRQGFEVDFACVKPLRFATLRRSLSTPIYDVEMRSRLDLSPVQRLVSIIRERGHVILHTHTPRAALVGCLAAAWTGVPLVHHLHSPTSCDTTHRWRNTLNAATERMAISRAAAVVAVSASVAEYARHIGVAHERTHLVHNGVPRWPRLASRPSPSGSWTLGCVALFRPRKGLEALLRALAMLRQQGRAVRLRAVGAIETTHYAAEVRSLAQSLGVAEHVDWRGFTSEVDRELIEMDALVLPSLFGEGLPMVVLEAMAAGVPVVATRVEGVPEAIRDGADGLLVPPGDAAALAAALERLLRGEADWQALRQSAYRRQCADFSDDSMAAGVANVYRRVLKDRRRSPLAHLPPAELAAAVRVPSMANR